MFEQYEEYVKDDDNIDMEHRRAQRLLYELINYWLQTMSIYCISLCKHLERINTSLQEKTIDF